MSQEVIFTGETAGVKTRVFFQLVDGTDGITGKTGQTGTCRLSKNGGATAASTNNIVEIDSTNMPGRYYLQLVAGEYDTLGTVVVRYKAAGTAEMVAQATVVAYDPFAAPSTTAQIADAILDRTDAVETGLTPRGLFRLAAAVLFGKATGLATTTAVYRQAIADTKARVTATVDVDGNRSVVTTDVT